MTAVDIRIEVPAAGGGWRSVTLAAPREWEPHPQPYRSRVAFAAAHVVADPWGENVPGAPAVVDWESTPAFRRHLFSYGLGVAEAMDTAQRNMGLDWPAVQELVRRSAEQAQAHGARIAAGAGTDHRTDLTSVDDVLAAYTEQVEFVEGTGAQVILMASRQLAAVAAGPDDYLRVYEALLRQVREPVILHWLGEAFDPQLAGYWGSADVASATATFVQLVEAHAAKVDGVKVSLLSAEHEIGLRAELPDGVRLYTGDDFNYPSLIAGDEAGHSDALLGVFDAIAPAAAAALHALDDGDAAAYHEILDPTVPLARRLFEAPTARYKTGIVFLAYLNGHQDHFRMVGGLESMRSVVHLADLFVLADRAGLLRDPALAVARMGHVLALSGVR
jgi:hypothetical protein